MPLHILMGLLLILAGVLNTTGCLNRHSWFWRSRKVQRMVGMVGEQGTLTFYLLFGLVLIAVGVASLLGYIF